MGFTMEKDDRLKRKENWKKELHKKKSCAVRGEKLVSNTHICFNGVPSNKVCFS